MANRLRAKTKKRRRDMASAEKKGEAPNPCKVATSRSRLHRRKRAFRQV